MSVINARQNTGRLILPVILLVLGTLFTFFVLVPMLSPDQVWDQHEETQQTRSSSSSSSHTSTAPPPLPPEWKWDEEDFKHINDGHQKGANSGKSEFSGDIAETVREAISVGGRSRNIAGTTRHEMYSQLGRAIGKVNGKKTEWVRIIFEYVEEGGRIVRQIKTAHPAGPPPF